MSDQSLVKSLLAKTNIEHLGTSIRLAFAVKTQKSEDLLTYAFTMSANYEKRLAKVMKGLSILGEEASDALLLQERSTNKYFVHNNSKKPNCGQNYSRDDQTANNFNRTNGEQSRSFSRGSRQSNSSGGKSRS